MLTNGYSMPIRGAKVLIFRIYPYIFHMKIVVSQRNLCIHVQLCFTFIPKVPKNRFTKKTNGTVQLLIIYIMRVRARV